MQFREVAGERSDTLGKLINDHPKIIPKPLNDVVSKIWGFSSEKARHIREEGGKLKYEDAELVVHISVALCTYLLSKTKKKELGAIAEDLSKGSLHF